MTDIQWENVLCIRKHHWLGVSMVAGWKLQQRRRRRRLSVSPTLGPVAAADKLPSSSH